MARLNPQPRDAADPASAPAEVGLLHDIYARPGFQLRRAYQILMAIAEEECARLGLTPHQQTCMGVLHRCGSLDQNSLARAMGTDRATLGQLLRRLEQRGWIERQTASADQRRKLVALTPQGAARVPQADDVADRVGRRLLAGLTPTEAVEWLALTRKLTGGAEHECPIVLRSPSTDSDAPSPRQ